MMSILKGFWKKIRLYLILVMLPTLIISYFIYEKETEKNRFKEQTNRYTYVKYSQKSNELFNK